MSDSERFPFSVSVTTAPGGSPEDLHITVLDSHDTPRAEGRGRLEEPLPPGLYTVRVERAGARVERVERHAAATSIELEEPLRYSAVPTLDTATTHEYYQGPAVHWSHTATPTTPSEPGGDGSLFVFLRAPSSERSPQPPIDGRFRLLDYSGHEIDKLVLGRARYDSIGWVAFHTNLAADEYVLSFAGDTISPPRELALSVFTGWQTQVFMTFVNTPLFASTSILLSGSGFNPDDRIARIVDAALAGLQGGRSALPPQETNELLYAKFDNPMLGLVGLHSLLQTTEPDASRVDGILGNLRSLLPDAPDVRALELIAADQLGLPYQIAPFERPPLLRAGLDAVLRAASGPRTELVAPGSLLATVAPRVLADCPWSSWEPVIGADDVATPEWMTGYVSRALITATRRNSEFDPARAASTVGLPVASVASAYDDLRNQMPPGTERTVRLERLAARARAGAAKSDLTAEQVRAQFALGGEGNRVEAIALMQGSERLRDFDVALEGIRGSLSAFEQYHALRLAEMMVPSLDLGQRSELADAVRADRHIQPGQDRWYLAQRLLSKLALQ